MGKKKHPQKKQTAEQGDSSSQQQQSQGQQQPSVTSGSQQKTKDEQGEAKKQQPQQSTSGNQTPGQSQQKKPQLVQETQMQQSGRQQQQQQQQRQQQPSEIKPIGQQQQQPQHVQQPRGKQQKQFHGPPLGLQQQQPSGNLPQAQQPQHVQQPWGQQQQHVQQPWGQQQQHVQQPWGQQQQHVQQPWGQQQQHVQQPWGQQQQHVQQPWGQQQQQHRGPSPGLQQQQRPRGQPQQQHFGPPPGLQQQQQQQPCGNQPQTQQQHHDPPPGSQQKHPLDNQPHGQQQKQKRSKDLSGQQQSGQGEALHSQKKELQQTVQDRKPISKAPQSKPQRTEVLEPGVSQAVRNVHEGSVKPAAQGVVSKVKTSLPPALQLELLQKIPRRQSPNVSGTKGRPITVLTNMMSLLVNSNFEKDAVHYDVTITPDKPKYMMRPVLEAFRVKHYPNRFPAFDGKKNLYSATLLPFGLRVNDSITVMNPERQKEQTFEVTLNKVREIDLSVFKSTDKLQLGKPCNMEALQVVETVLRHGPSLHFTTVGRSFFQPPRETVSLSDGMDLWIGTYQSVVLGWKPYVNVDVAHKGFPTSQNVINLMHELSKQRSFGRGPPQPVTAEQVNYKRNDIHDYIKGLKVHYEIPGMPLSKRTVRVNGLVKAANQEIFTLDDGNKCTVEQYFMIQKKYKLQYPDYPCLWIGPRDKTIYVPPELCTIMAGQATMKKLNPEQTRNMIRAAATSTEIRKQKIMNAFENLNVNNYPTTKNEFGLSVQGKFETVPARVLNPPKVHYENRDTFVQKGVWNVGKFVAGMTMNENEWAILSLDRNLGMPRLQAFEEELQRQAQNVGMSIGRSERPYKVIQPPTRDIREITAYFREKKAKGVKLVIVIIPEFGDIYSKVKQITELNVGLVTQCIKRRTMDKLSDATVVNILLKINSKLNGVNHTLAKSTRPKCLDSRCMIIGADVTHPAPDSTQTPSIAAVTSSFDTEAFQYHIEIRLQPPLKEVILDMEKIVGLQLAVYKKHRGYYPNIIIVYRDGVSDSQVPQVIHHELGAIKRACNTATTQYLPVTFFVVQKRHHIRLFPTDPRNSDDARKNMNVQAGTIVDTHITHPTHIDFYLVSHASIQGTARPTKYKCIWNDLNMADDDIEELTYYLCHLFARCTRSVSYPAPTYYAHLAAFRARALTQNVPIRMDRLEDEQRTKLTLQVNQDAPMFFV